ncbi:MAG TPA: HDIG domain-containing protein [Candidatus Xenobia bacterium]
MNIEKIRKVVWDGVHKHVVQYFLMALFVFVSVAGLCVLNFLPTPLMSLAVGQVSPRDIEAPRTINYVNEVATEEARRHAMLDVPPVFSADPAIESKSQDELHRTFLLLQQISHTPALKAELEREAPLALQGDAASLEILDPTTLAQLETVARTSLHSVMHKGLKEEDLKTTKDALQTELKAVPMQSGELAAITALTVEALRPNAVYDWAETARRQQERQSAVPPVTVSVQRGTMIVRRGEVVTPEASAILQAFGNSQVELNFRSTMGTVLFTLTAMALLLFYLAQYYPELLPNIKRMWLVVLLLVAAAFLCHWLEQTNGYLSPVALCAMLTAILVDYRIALMSTLILCCLVGLFTGDYAYVVAALMTGSTGVLAVAHVNRRADLIRASLLVILINTLSALSMDLIRYNMDSQQLMTDTVYGALDGLIASLTVMGALPFLENLFDVTTHIKLLELANPGEPLLQKLMVEAPGTYHHSIIVANLADAAARAVSADALLARVGAYYHDIGKMKRSTFFVENQIGVENPHDRLTPSVSTMIIHSHVSEGIEMAKEYRLPQPIRDFIDMHHGTRLVAYFYHQARQKVGADVPESNFRYHGRKPHTKETAIVMVADSIEAKARLMRHIDRDAVQAMVNETLKTIMSDGQLDDSDLSLRDIRQISEAFTNTLMGIYHNRVEYPKDVLKTLEEAADKNSTAAALIPETPTSSAISPSSSNGTRAETPAATAEPH